MSWSLSRGAHIALVMATSTVAVMAVAVTFVVAAPSARPSGAAPCISIVNDCSPTTTFHSVTTTTEEPTTTSTEPETTTTTFETATVDTTPLTVPTDITGVTSPTTPVPTTRPPRRRVTVLPAITPASVTGSYSVGLATVLLVALGLFAITQRRSARKGTRMNATRRWRFFAGLGCIALAGIVGILGYLKLSLEPLVNRQIPYLASAGMALVLLAAVGGSLLVAEQLRTDDDRIEQLEAAVRRLADAVSATVEAPARRAVK